MTTKPLPARLANDERWVVWGLAQIWAVPHGDTSTCWRAHALYRRAQDGAWNNGRDPERNAYLESAGSRYGRLLRAKSHIKHTLAEQSQ